MRYLILLIGALSLSSCLEFGASFDSLAPGVWRAELTVDETLASTERLKKEVKRSEHLSFDEANEGKLPFLLDVSYEDEQPIIHIINGDHERIRIEDISYGVDRSTGRDTLHIKFPVFDSEIQALVEEDIMEGVWRLNYRPNSDIPFTARFGQNFRFSQLKKPTPYDLTGKWEVRFGLDTESPYPALGEFIQKGNKLEGTFLTETGDYRYLAGTVQNDKFYLSTFDGAHAFLFEGKIKNENQIEGIFRSGKHYKTVWSGKRNEQFQLTSPHNLTKAVNGQRPIDFQFISSDGKMVSLNDAPYKGKAKIVQIFGTWCPNCKDEAKFLKSYFEEHPTDQLEIISLAFERYADTTTVLKHLSNYKQEMGWPYTVLWAGGSNKSAAGKALPMIDRVISYPTMIFLDQNNVIQDIHTGFNGPATSKYEDFKRDFDQQIKQLINEK